MGFFSKEKISSEQLAEKLADLVFNSISEKSLQNYKTLFIEMKEDEEIDERQKKEILVFEMLAATRAITKSFSPEEAKFLLDKLYEKIYHKISSSGEEQSKFEEFINDRYKVYYEILSSKDDNMMFNFGKQFANYLLNRDVTGDGVVLIVSSAEFFAATIDTLENLFKDISLKYCLEI